MHSVIQISRLTGSSIPFNIISTGPDVFLRFVKTSTGTRKGFELRYDTGKRHEILHII